MRTKTAINQNRYFSLFTGKIARRLYGANACDKHNAQSSVPQQMYLFLRKYTSLTSRDGGRKLRVSKGWWRSVSKVCRRCVVMGVGSILPSQKNVVPLCQQSPKRKCGWVAETNSLLNCRTGNRTGGSNPPASAVKGVNQRITWFTPFFAPKKSLVGIFDSATSMVLCFAMSI